MNFILVQIFSYSIVIAALIGLVRFKKISQVYYPFIVLLWIGLANEIFSTIIISYSHSNAVNSNIYTLIESLLLLVLFRNWGIFNRNKKLFNFLVVFFLTAWAVDVFLISKITMFSSYFRVLYSFIIVLLSINKINRLAVEEKNKREKRAVFFLLIGFIVFFTYQALVEIFWIYGLNASRDFRKEVYRIMTYINLSVNLIYAIALVWMPRKRKSLLQ